MKSSDAFPSKYLRTADLQGREFHLTITAVRREEVGDGDIKPVMFFQGAEKGMVVNKTKWMAMSAMYGDESDNWIGAQITLFPTKVLFKSDMVDSIGLRPAAPTAPQTTVAAPLGAPPAIGETPPGPSVLPNAANPAGTMPAVDTPDPDDSREFTPPDAPGF